MGGDDRKRRFGKRLKELRDASGLSQGELAGMLQAQGQAVKPSTLSGWELGNVSPRNRRVVVALELALGDAESSLSKALGLPPRPEVIARVEHIPTQDVYDRLDAIEAHMAYLASLLESFIGAAEQTAEQAPAPTARSGE